MLKNIKLVSTKLYLIGLYLLTRLTFLTRLPVFADEAIYIRWAQIGLNEPEKYRLLSMLDGKPPLHNWLIKPFLFMFKDPLFAGRFLSVLAGGITIIFLYKLSLELFKNKNHANITVLLAILLPFWITNHRLALAESLLSLFFTTAIYYAIKAFKNKNIAFTLLFGLSFGLSLWTKTNSIFFIPIFALIPLLISSVEKRKIVPCYLSQNTKRLVVGGVIGSIFFLTLKSSELFPFLFTRSQDYTFSIKELISGEWQHVIYSTIPRVAKWLFWYMVPSSFIVMFYEKKTNRVLLLMTIAYLAPLIFMGKVLSSRYFFPVATLLNLMIANGLINSRKNVLDKKVATIFIYLSIIISIGFSSLFILSPDKTPFTKEDRIQYLEEWSSGHGIPEVRDFIKERIQNNKVTVATEGYFGTLPDGLLMYFDKSENLKNLEIFGIGQPVRNIGNDLLQKSEQREVYVVVNSHRLNVDLTPNIQKIAEFKRPNDAPTLVLLKVNPMKE